MTKSAKYYYASDAIRETQDVSRLLRLKHGWKGNENRDYPDGLQNHIKDYMDKSNNEIENLKGANKRTVWTIPIQSYPEAHFATYPEKLIEPCVLAGCPKEICSKCGKAVERIVKKEYFNQSKSDTEKYTQKEFGTNQTYGRGIVKIKTIGFEPSCSCGAELVPGVIYDPFMGAGTTAKVALRAERNYIGSEISEEYCRIAENRIRSLKDQMKLDLL